MCILVTRSCRADLLRPRRKPSGTWQNKDRCWAAAGSGSWCAQHARHGATAPQLLRPPAELPLNAFDGPHFTHQVRHLTCAAGLQGWR